MPQKPKRRHSCDGKVKSPSRARAVGQMQRLVMAGVSPGRLNVYRCRFCWIHVDGKLMRPWHVGHKMMSGKP